MNTEEIHRGLGRIVDGLGDGDLRLNCGGAVTEGSMFDTAADGQRRCRRCHVPAELRPEHCLHHIETPLCYSLRETVAKIARAQPIYWEQPLPEKR